MEHVEIITDARSGKQTVRPYTAGEIAALAPRPPTLDEVRAAIAAHVEATARSRHYDSATSCASYVTSTVPAWAAEARAFVAWRDAVWAFAFAQMTAVQQGLVAAPATTQALLDALPAIAWP